MNLTLNLHSVPAGVNSSYVNNVNNNYGSENPGNQKKRKLEEEVDNTSFPLISNAFPTENPRKKIKVAKEENAENSELNVENTKFEEMNIKDNNYLNKKITNSKKRKLEEDVENISNVIVFSILPDTPNEPSRKKIKIANEENEENPLASENIENPLASENIENPLASENIENPKFKPEDTIFEEINENDAEINIANSELIGEIKEESLVDEDINAAVPEIKEYEFMRYRDFHLLDNFKYEDEDEINFEENKKINFKKYDQASKSSIIIDSGLPNNIISNEYYGLLTNVTLAETSVLAIPINFQDTTNNNNEDSSLDGLEGLLNRLQIGSDLVLKDPTEHCLDTQIQTHRLT